MIEVASESGAIIIIMHMLGSPQTMQIDPRYDNIIDDILNFFELKIDSAIKRGID